MIITIQYAVKIGLHNCDNISRPIAFIEICTCIKARLVLDL